MRRGTGREPWVRGRPSHTHRGEHGWRAGAAGRKAWRRGLGRVTWSRGPEWADSGRSPEAPSEGRRRRVSSTRRHPSGAGRS